MHRDAFDFLSKWKQHRNNKPLLITGHTGTGKTYLVKNFAKHAEYETTVFIDCMEKDLSSICVLGASGRFLIDGLESITGKHIFIGKSLIVFDNIQYAPDLLSFLPVFYKDVPEQNVIAIGRIYDIPDSVKNCVDVYDLKPFSFMEFFHEYDPNLFDTYMRAPLAETQFHDQFHKAYRYYLAIGGMPECIEAWKESDDLTAVDEIQKRLLENCMLDYKRENSNFGERCYEAFASLPKHLAKKNQKFKLSCISDKRQARSYHEAVDRLIHDKYMIRLHSTDPRDVVVFSFDTGLLKSMTGADDDDVVNKADFPSLNMLAWNFFMQNHRGLNIHYEPNNHGRRNFLICDIYIYRYDIDITPDPNVKKHSLDKENRWLVFSEKHFFREKGALNIPIYMAPRLSETLKTYEDWSEVFG